MNSKCVPRVGLKSKPTAVSPDFTTEYLILILFTVHESNSPDSLVAFKALLIVSPAHGSVKAHLALTKMYNAERNTETASAPGFLFPLDGGIVQLRFEQVILDLIHGHSAFFTMQERFIIRHVFFATVPDAPVSLVLQFRFGQRVGGDVDELILISF